MTRSQLSAFIGQQQNGINQPSQGYHGFLGQQNNGLLTYDPKVHYLALNSKLIESKETNMVTEVVQDLKKFVRDHKSTIYVLAILLIVDHFMFNGAMKQRLQTIMQNLVGKVEAKLNETNV